MASNIVKKVDLKRIERIVSIIVLNERGQVLLLKRADTSASYYGKWNFLSGGIENESPVECARRELSEELGSDVRLTLITEGTAFIDAQKEGSWQVYPFVFQLISGIIKINNEHSEYKWVEKDELSSHDIVPGILEDLKHVEW